MEIFCTTKNKLWNFPMQDQALIFLVRQTERVVTALVSGTL